MAQARFSVRTAVAEGFDFWRTNWLKGIGALILAAVFGVTLQVMAKPDNLPQLFTLALIVSVAQIPAQAAFYRMALADLGAEPPEKNGPFGLQWRMLETRLLGAGALVVMLMFIVVMLGLFMMLAVMAGMLQGVDLKTLVTPAAVEAALTPSAALAMNLIMLVLLVGVIILSVRLSMVQAATAAENKIQIFSSFRLTKGAVLRIFGAMLLINMPLVLLQAVAVMYAGKNLALLAGMNIILTGIAPFFVIPISVGAIAHIYRRLRAPEGAA